MCRGSHGLYIALCHQHKDSGGRSSWVIDIIHKDIKKSGPRRLPCVTPQRRDSQSDSFPLHFTRWKRPDIYDWISFMSESWTLKAFSFASNTLWQIESNALERSIATTATSFLLSRAWRQSSVSFNLIKRNSENAQAGALTYYPKRLVWIRCVIDQILVSQTPCV